MRKNSETIRLLVDYFDQNSWPLYVNQEKLWDRVSVGRDDEFPGCDIVRIERHRSILGMQYQQGLGMDAFETYYMRYAVADHDGTVAELEEEKGEISINGEAMASSLTDTEHLSLEIRRLADDRYRIYDGVSKDEKIVGSLDEALAFGDELASGYEDMVYDNFSMECSDGTLSSDQATESANHVMKAIGEEIREKIRALWERRKSVEYDDE